MNAQCLKCGDAHPHILFFDLKGCPHCKGTCRQRKDPRHIPFEHRTPEEQLQVDMEDIRGEE